MRGFLERMNWRMEKWMQGRYGQDELNRFLIIGALLLLLFSSVSVIFAVLGTAALIWGQFRCYSKKLDKRERERQAYLNVIARPKKWWSLQKRRWAERKTHRYYKCKKCKTVLRVPRGKGKIAITCPKCQTTNTHKT